MCTDHMHIVPPVLHIMLGLTVRFYQKIEKICREADQKSAISENEDLNLKWQNASVNVQSKSDSVENLKAELKYRKELLKGFEKSKSGKSGRGMSDKCDMPACAIEKHRVSGLGEGEEDDIQWVECENCDEETWYHVDCVGLRGVNYASDDFVFKCPMCTGEIRSAEDVVKWQKSRVSSVESELKESEKGLKESQSELDEIYRDVQSRMGEREKELYRIVIDTLNVKKQAYHSQCFVGNHCNIILQNAEKVTAPLKGLPEFDNYLELFRRLRHILVGPFAEAKFLSPKQVEDLNHSCWALGEWFPKAFPNETIPPKLHILIAHVPECAQAWGTLGILSEHGLESLHAQVNADIRQFASVCDKQQQMRLCFNQHAQRAAVSSKGLKRTKRKAGKLTMIVPLKSATRMNLMCSTPCWCITGTCN